MKYLMILMISTGFALAQPAGNCTVQTRTITLSDMEKTGQLRNEMTLLESQLRDLRQTHTEDHPRIQALQTRLQQLRAQQRRVAGFKLTGLQACRGDRWWDNPSTAREVGLSTDQIKKMDDVFTQYRLKLIDLNGALEKEEIIMEPLVSAEQIDEAKMATQIDRIAQARAELEKANGRMLLAIRKQLTPEQWAKLNHH
jgi:hypothetical protein